MRALSPRWKVGAPPGTMHVSSTSKISSRVPPRRRARRGGVVAVAQAQLVDVVVGLDEFRVLPRRELPLRVDVAARLFHPRDESVRPLGTVARCRLAHGSLLLVDRSGVR